MSFQKGADETIEKPETYTPLTQFFNNGQEDVDIQLLDYRSSFDTNVETNDEQQRGGIREHACDNQISEAASSKDRQYFPVVSNGLQSFYSSLDVQRIPKHVGKAPAIDLRGPSETLQSHCSGSTVVGQESVHDIQRLLDMPLPRYSLSFSNSNQTSGDKHKRSCKDDGNRKCGIDNGSLSSDRKRRKAGYQQDVSSCTPESKIRAMMDASHLENKCWNLHKSLNIYEQGQENNMKHLSIEVGEKSFEDSQSLRAANDRNFEKQTAFSNDIFNCFHFSNSPTQPSNKIQPLSYPNALNATEIGCFDVVPHIQTHSSSQPGCQYPDLQHQSSWNSTKQILPNNLGRNCIYGQNQLEHLELSLNVDLPSMPSPTSDSIRETNPSASANQSKLALETRSTEAQKRAGRPRRSKSRDRQYLVMKRELGYDGNGYPLPGTFECTEPTCKKLFGCDKARRRHISLQHGRKSKSHVCAICKHSYVSKENLHKHYGNCHDPQLDKIYCDQCEAHFTSLFCLQTHKNTMHNAKKNCSQEIQKYCYVCPICEETALEENNMYRHIRLKHKPAEESKFACEICGVKKKTKANLKAHINTVHRRSEIQPSALQRI